MVVTPLSRRAASSRPRLLSPVQIRRSQRQVGAVGFLQRLFRVGDFFHRQDRAEGFLAHGEHVVGQFREQGGGEEEAVVHVAHRL